MSYPRQLAAPFFVLALLAPTTNADPPIPEAAAIHQQETELEESISELRRQELAAEEELLLARARLMQVRLELAEERRERSKLVAERRALTLEANGHDRVAEFVRREAALNFESMGLMARKMALEVENLQQIEPLKLESQTYGLSRRIPANVADRPANDEKLRERRQLSAKIGAANADLARRKHSVQRQLAAVKHSQYEHQRDWALLRDDPQAAERYQGSAERAAAKRAELEIESVFLELHHELLQKDSELNLALMETTDQAERAALRGRLDVLSEDRRRLSQSRQTFRSEVQLQQIQHHLGEHLQRLESARGSASDSEADNLEEEIQRLKTAATQLVEQVLHGDPG
ncbi:MAG: hypothetical protein AAF657_14310 [Acidobacteriota bacterium]